MKWVQVAVLCLCVAFVAGEKHFFEGRSIDSIKRLLGYVKNNDINAPKLPDGPSYNFAVPTSFDARQQWPNCTSIGTIQNQAECGSCWAFGAVESITDRFCIHKNDDTQLSFEDMVSCDTNDGGCQGGDPSTAWAYAKKVGLVSAACYPYTIPTCPPAQQPCLNFVNTPDCTHQCTNTSINWDSDKRLISTAYMVHAKDSGIENEILKNGPVEACFDVYEDFLNYTSGVYSHSSGDLLGGHCIKLIGWGVDSGVDYWVAANSWTTYWGNQGYFWIKRGVNECGIEDDVVAGLP